VSQTLHPEDALLNEYLDGCLPPPEQASLQTHLSTCPSCAQRLAVLQSVFNALAGLSEEPLERDLSSVVRTALRTPPARTERVRGGFWVMIAVELSLSLGLLILTWQPQIFQGVLFGIQQGASRAFTPVLMLFGRLLLQWQALSHLAPDVLDRFMAGIGNLPLPVLSVQVVLIGLAATGLVWLVVHIVLINGSSQ
jgi:anti-sigma factor RsiW